MNSGGAAYFSRQLVLKDFGKKGQKALARSRVVVVGLGGTGTVVSVSLALAGVGHLSLVDRDAVSLENLHRQLTYSLEDVGRSKAEVSAGFIEARVPGIDVMYRTESLDKDNASRLIRRSDLVVDCLDNMEARYALNRSCVQKGIPLLHTGCTGWDGSVALFIHPETACLECLFPREAWGPLPSCDVVGTLGAMTSLIGAMGALEAVRFLAMGEPQLAGSLLAYDGRRGTSHVVRVQRRSGCTACGSGSLPDRRTGIVELCGEGEFYVNRAFSSGQFASLPRRLGHDPRRMGDSVVFVNRGHLTLSFFRHGGLLIKGASSAEEARNLLESLPISARKGTTSRRKS